MSNIAPSSPVERSDNRVQRAGYANHRRSHEMSMRPFCSNVSCTQNTYLVDDLEYRIEVENSLGRRQIQRHTYINRYGTKFELCTICHEATQMLKANEYIEEEIVILKGKNHEM